MMQTNDIFISDEGMQQIEKRAFEIVFEQYESMCKSDDIKVQEFIHTLGKEEFYQSLKFEFNVLYSLLYTQNLRLFKDFFIWKYSVYFHRGLDCDFFLIALEYWQDTFFGNLHNAHASALNSIYEQLKQTHQKILQEAKQMPYVEVDPSCQDFVDELSIYLLNGKEKEGYEFVAKTLNNFEDIYEYIDKVIQPIMKRVGLLWQTAQISVAKEHLATATIGAIVHKFIFTNNSQEKKLAVASTVGDELHIFGVKLIGDYLQTKGYGVIHLGLDNTPHNICEQVKSLNPDIVVLSITLSSNIAPLQKTVTLLKKMLEFKGKIIVGGQGLHEPQKVTIENADFQSNSLQDLKEYLE